MHSEGGYRVVARFCDQRQFSLPTSKVDREVVDGRIVEWGLAGCCWAGCAGERGGRSWVDVGHVGDVVTSNIVNCARRRDDSIVGSRPLRMRSLGLGWFENGSYSVHRSAGRARGRWE